MTQFQHGICGCLDDCGTCIVTYFLPCYTAGKNAEAMGENCLLYGLAYMCGVGYITTGLIWQKIREKYGIQGSFPGDVVCHCFCSLCALVQEAWEITAHGGDVPGGNAIAPE